MDQIVTFLLSNPLWLAVAVVVSLVVVLLMLKKVFKLLLFAGALFILYIAYLYWTGGDVAGSVDVLDQFLRSWGERVLMFFKGLGFGGTEV